MTQLSTLDFPAEEAIRWITQQLEEAGLQVSRSFNLRSARTVETGCTCSHHAGDCDCDLVVLLVYGSDSPYPVSLVAHSHDGRTWLSLVDIDGMGERPSQQVETAVSNIISGLREFRGLTMNSTTQYSQTHEIPNTLDKR